VIGLSSSLLLGGGRRGAMRLLLVVAGVAVGVAMVLGALAIGPARDAQDRRDSIRTTPPNVAPSDPRPALLWGPGRQYGWIGPDQLVLIEVAATGPGAPLPLGADRMPTPGEVLVSPALKRLLDSNQGAVYRQRFPGRVASTLGPAVLHDPSELVAIVGVEPGALRDAYRVTDWHAARPAPPPASGGTFNRRLVYLLAALGVLIPIGVFIAASARVGASTRERRYAALRLIGATPKQVALAAAGESAVAGVLGAIAGLLLALAVRTQSAHFSAAGYAGYPSDFTVPLWQIVLVIVATPVLAAAVTVESMRRVVTTPLGVTRSQASNRPSAWRAAPLALCWLELAWAVQAGDGLGENGKMLALGAGFAGVILGIVIAGPWLVGMLAALVARLARGPGALIAGRRLQSAPGTAFRAVGGAVLGVFAATAVLVFLPSQERWAAADTTASIMPPAADASVQVFRNGAPRSVTDTLARDLAAVPGVRAVLPSARVHIPGQGDVSGLFASCADARKALNQRIGRCPANGVLIARQWGLKIGDRLRVRGVQTRVVGYIPLGYASVLIPPDAVAPPPHPTEWTLVTDARLETAQRIRAAHIASGLTGDVQTAADNAVPSQSVSSVRRQAQLVVLLMLSIAGCSLAVMMIEGIVERRRELATLAATGTRPRDLRTAAALEVLIPLGVASSVSCAIGVLVTATLLRVRGIGLVVPWGDLATLLVMTLVVAAAVLALGLPTLGRVIRADNLRTE
jgi:hypothetical protein